jgi:hypothetical protein
VKPWHETTAAVAALTALFLGELLALEVIQIRRHGPAGTITYAARRVFVEYTWAGLGTAALAAVAALTVALHVVLGLRIVPQETTNLDEEEPYG